MNFFLTQTINPCADRQQTKKQGLNPCFFVSITGPQPDIVIDYFLINFLVTVVLSAAKRMKYIPDAKALTSIRAWLSVKRMCLIS